MSILDKDGTPLPPTAPEKPAYRVLVGVPCHDMVQQGFAFDLATMLAGTVAARKDIDIRLCHWPATVVHASRRNLVKRALATDCTHILFLDSDMRFPRNTLVRLLAHGAPIVGANYSTRAEPSYPVSFRNEDSDKERVYTEPDSTGLEAVNGTGFGVMLIDMEVFRELPQPWFSFEWKTPSHMVGEDLYFSRKARAELGVETYIDHDLSKEIRHVGVKEYTLADTLVSRELASEELARIEAAEAAERATLGAAPEVN